VVVRFLKLWKHSWKYQPNVGKIHFSSLFHMFPSTVTQLQFCVPLVRQNIILPRAYDRGCSQCSSQEAWGKRRAKCILQSHTLSDLITKWYLPQNILWSYELYTGDLMIHHCSMISPRNTAALWVKQSTYDPLGDISQPNQIDCGFFF
jgi:hypothetical protein